MNITIAKGFLQIATVDSRNVLLDKLKQCVKGYVILGDNSEQEKDFYLVKLFSQEDGNEYFGIGIISEGHGLQPNIMVNHLENSIFFGFNKEVVLFNCLNKVVVKRYQIDSLFYNFVNLAEQNCVLVVHELGIIKITINGEKIWNYTSEIICGLRLDNNAIELFLEEGSHIHLSLSSGKRI